MTLGWYVDRPWRFLLLGRVLVPWGLSVSWYWFAGGERHTSLGRGAMRSEFRLPRYVGGGERWLQANNAAGKVVVGYCVDVVGLQPTGPFFENPGLLHLR